MGAAVGTSLWQNWSGTEHADPARTVRPADAEELAAAVTAAASEGLRVKAVGAGHSFSGIAVADGVQIDMGGLDQVVAVEQRTGLVRWRPGCRCTGSTRSRRARARAGDHGRHRPADDRRGDLDRDARQRGAVRRDLDAGRALGWSSRTARSYVCRDASGRSCSQAARLGVGALGVITEVTLQCVPAFRLQAVERPEPLEAGWGTSTSWWRERPLRVLLVPAHRAGADEAEQALPDDGPRSAPTASCWWTTGS